MNKRVKDKKGITLIALIVTIILLLILAGVAIGTLNGEQGLLKKAIKAKNEQEVQTAKEVLSMGLSDILVQNSGNKDLNMLYSLKFDDYKVEVSNFGRIVTMTKNNVNYNFLVDTDYNIYDLNKFVTNWNQEETKGEQGNGTGTEISSGTSKIIKKINIQYTIRSSKILLEISTEQEDSNLVKGYHIYLDNKLYTVSMNDISTFYIEGLKKNTKYQIYVIAFDIDGNYKKSDILDLTTLDAEYKEVKLKNPVLTDKGMMNRKFVNTENEMDYYFELDLNLDDSKLFELDKGAYDSDESTVWGGHSFGCFDVDVSAVGKRLCTKSRGLELYPPGGGLGINVMYEGEDMKNLYFERFKRN